MKIDVPYGEVADRISILLLKEERLSGPIPIENTRRHLALLRAAWAEAGLEPVDALSEWPELFAVNARLWDVEDALRECERQGRFDATFVELARSVYQLNDRRAALKRAIDTSLGSPLVEEKSHPA
jgi:hypothetical protein